MEPIATAAATLPETLGRYELLGVLDRGGMANVSLGRQAQNQRTNELEQRRVTSQ